MATLPRLKPTRFYDLVVEVALIRPGPIQGGSVHPYIRRRNGAEPVTYLHPLLEPVLKKTLGVPLFQEQLMQIAIEIAGFTPGEADQLRQAMASKRSRERMERIRRRLYDGMAERGVVGDVADQMWDKLSAFANYGFPESHSVSFAYLVYASSWLKRFYPAAFCAGLLNAQPMGFYSPHSLVQDARRHGVEIRTPDLNESGAKATLEIESGVDLSRASHDAPPAVWGKAGPIVRLGIGSVRGIGEELADEIAAGRPYASTGRPGAAGAVAHAAATRGDGHRGRVRLFRPVPPRGVVVGRRGRADATRPSRRHRDRRRGAGPAGDVRTGGVQRRPVGHRRRAGRSSHPVRTSAPRRVGSDSGIRARGDRRRREGARRRRGDPSPTSGHRARGHVRQPRGRDRSHQRGVLERLLGAVPAGRRFVPGVAHPREVGEAGGRDQRQRRTHRPPPPDRAPPRAATSADPSEGARMLGGNGRYSACFSPEFETCAGSVR